MTPGLRVEIEIDLAGHPLVVEFSQQSGNEPQARLGIGKDAHHPTPSPELAVGPPPGSSWCAAVRGERLEGRRRSDCLIVANVFMSIYC